MSKTIGKVFITGKYDDWEFVKLSKCKIKHAYMSTSIVLKKFVSVFSLNVKQ